VTHAPATAPSSLVCAPSEFEQCLGRGGLTVGSVPDGLDLVLLNFTKIIDNKFGTSLNSNSNSN
jgi:hypothetical protein